MPEVSVAVAVTVKLEPTSLQLNSVRSSVTLATAQLSALLATASPTLTLYAPLASSATVKSAAATTLGTSSSDTNTVTVVVALLPLGSTAVSVTTLAPASAQLNTVLSAVTLTPQLSPDDDTSDATLTLARPVALSVTLNVPTDVTVGSVVSTTLTDTLSVAWLPEVSVAVAVTVKLEPTSLQLNAVRSSVTLATAQLSALLATASPTLTL